MMLGNAEAVAALREGAARLCAVADGLDEKADRLERVGGYWAEGRDAYASETSAGAASGEGPMETLGHVWKSEAAEAYVATIEERERKLDHPDYDIDVIRGCSKIGDALDRLKGRYGDTLDIRDLAVVFLDAGVCRSNAATRKQRVERVKTKVYEHVKKSADWERAPQNTIQWVRVDVGRKSGDSMGGITTGVGT